MTSMRGRVSAITGILLTGALAAGCMGQSSPSVEIMTRPTMDAFARLGSWRPWSRDPEPVHPAAPLPAATAVEVQPLPPPADAIVEPPRLAAVTPAPIATAATRHVQRRIPPASLSSPARTTTRAVAPSASTASDAALVVPVALSCRTAPAQPGQRVRMECSPVD